MTKTLPRVLVDSDDVLSDFSTPAKEYMLEQYGIDASLEEVPDWDIFNCLSVEQREHLQKEWMDKPGLASSFNICPGAYEGFQALREIADVYVVTRPVKTSPTWFYERCNWLVEKFDFPEKKIIGTAAKYAVYGQALLDDHPTYVTDWLKNHPKGLGMLWNTPNTKNLKEHDHLRVYSWDAVLENVRNLTV